MGPRAPFHLLRFRCSYRKDHHHGADKHFLMLSRETAGSSGAASHGIAVAAHLRLAPLGNLHPPSTRNRSPAPVYRAEGVGPSYLVTCQRPPRPLDASGIDLITHTLYMRMLFLKKANICFAEPLSRPA
ncbi:hypothetical protein D623_10012154 [Myotis brandtii]|uniref:Uncharacterized protein n=1 Tax=Myotis brandtii TaxID=109478 RepID=S7NNU5_MYOBR|nr:hypothetical protein D623_10012154 [Myotis brandtii]